MDTLLWVQSPRKLIDHNRQAAQDVVCSGLPVMCYGSHRYHVIGRRRPVSGRGFGRMLPRLGASLGLLVAVPESVRIVAGLHYVAMVHQPIQQCTHWSLDKIPPIEAYYG